MRMYTVYVQDPDIVTLKFAFNFHAVVLLT